jgi:hypothetical protein
MTEFATHKYRTTIFQLECEFKFFNPCQKGKGKFTYCAAIEEYQIDLERPTKYAATNPLKSSQAPQSIK